MRKRFRKHGRQLGQRIFSILFSMLSGKGARTATIFYPIFNPDIKWDVQTVFNEGYKGLPDGLVTSVTSAYQAALSQFAGYATSVWSGIDSLKRDIHAALVSVPSDADAVARILSDPGATDLFWGVDPTFPESTAEIRASPGGSTQLICDRILRFAEAVGALPLRHPLAGA